MSDNGRGDDDVVLEDNSNNELSATSLDYDALDLLLSESLGSHSDDGRVQVGSKRRASPFPPSLQTTSGGSDGKAATKRIKLSLPSVLDEVSIPEPAEEQLHLLDLDFIIHAPQFGSVPGLMRRLVASNQTEVDLGPVAVAICKGGAVASSCSPFRIEISNLPTNDTMLSPSKLITIDPVSHRILADRKKQLAGHRRKKAIPLRSGQGGLLDAIVTLAHDSISTGITLACTLSVSPSRYKAATSATPPSFRLHIALFLSSGPAFSQFPESIAKRTLFLRLFPIVATTEVTVKAFYDALDRAPRTMDGRPCLKSAEVVEMADTAETEDEKVTRVRREAKGKGRAREAHVGEFDACSSEARKDRNDEGPDDVLLRPVGLLATLLPFQSRTVRWMLAQEGKVALLVETHEAREDIVREVERIVERNGNGNGKAKMEERMEHDSLDDAGRVNVDASNVDGDDQYAQEDLAMAEAVSNREDVVDTFRLVDVSEAEKLRSRRSPLWYQTALPLLSPSNTHGMKVDIWVNRITSELSIDDPAMRHEVPIDAKPEGNVAMEVDGVVGDYAIGARTPEIASGGLFEEMGLGKTIEVISLILLHRPERNSLPSYYNVALNFDVQPTSMTLIISPASIYSQWASELQKHAPSLRVLLYTSLRAVKEDVTCQQLSLDYDIILTTFDVLRSEVGIARKPHEKSLRSIPGERRKYRRSLLVQFEFLRVIMDEAQSIGDSVSITSETASLIPRIYSFAVTGTPLRHRVGDLQSMLKFLRVEPVGSNNAMANRLLADPESFARVCKSIGARTTKHDVRFELVLPQQKRYLVPISFGDIELYWYGIRYNEALEAIGLSSDGHPRVNPSEMSLDSTQMNLWLTTLRQICCHPSTGASNKRELGHQSSAKSIQTMEEVLESMRSTTASGVDAETRALWLSRTQSAQLMCWEKEECENFERALEIFSEAIIALTPVKEGLLLSLKGMAQDLKEEKIRRGRSLSETVYLIEGIDSALDFHNDSSDLRLSDAERGMGAKVGQLRSRLRDVLLVQHAAFFLSGSAWNNLGKFSELEDASYAQADAIRETLLKPYEVEVTSSNSKLVDAIALRDEKAAFDITDMEITFSDARPSILSTSIFQQIEETTNSLNGIAELVWQYRDFLLSILSSAVSISGEAVEAGSIIDAYSERAESQEKADVYLEGLENLLAEWRFGLTGERSALADFDATFSKSKKSEWAAADGSRRRKALKGKTPVKELDHEPDLAIGDSPADVLRYRLRQERDAAKSGTAEMVPIRSLLKDLRGVLERSNRAEEIAIVHDELTRLRVILADKTKVLERLSADLSDITKTFNVRIDYFKQLQIISDSVQDPDPTSKLFRGYTTEIAIHFADEEKLLKSIQLKAAQKRYLETLTKRARLGIEDKSCVICTEVYDEGVLTNCGHVFCGVCFRRWLSEASTCPTCKRPISSKQYTLTRAEKEAAVEEEVAEVSIIEEEAKNRLRQTLQINGARFIENSSPLSHLDFETIAKISDMDVIAPLSSKSSFIVKHIQLLRLIDPTAKIVILSAWVESLSILMRAFDLNGIEFVRLEGGGRKNRAVQRFVNDPEIPVFLLHTLSQGAGLNLTVARYVFLVEPLFHSSIEQQAVGRIHRIGQTKETTVFQYYISDTVDQRVAELRGRQGTSLFLSETAAASSPTQTASADVDQSSRNVNMEVINDEDDVATCLLDPGHMRVLQCALFPPALHNTEGEPSSDRLEGFEERVDVGGVASCS